MKITAPLPPNMANGRMHWRVKHKAKQEYEEQMTILWALQRIPRPPKPLPRRVTITATLYVHNPMDDDNALARLKWLVDWLVNWEYLPGDSRKHIQWAGIPGQVVDRKNPRVELELTAA